MALMIKKKIWVITGSRAEFGILYPLIKNLQAEKKFKTEVVVSGHHFNKKQGLSINEVKKSKVKNVIFSKSHLKHTSTLLVSLYSSKIVKDFTLLYKKHRPNMVIVLGDRYEILSSILPLIFFKIPVIHFNGGEKTSGSFDDQIRHIITKISNYHFVANKEYKKRVIQLGENPKNVFNFGGISNFIDKKNLLPKNEIIKKLNLNPNLKIVLSTFHPETNKSKKYNIDAFNILLDCLKNLKKTNIVLTYPNLDPGSSDLTKILNKLEKKKYKNIYTFKSLGRKNYLSLMKQANLVIGNSSSGIIETSIFNTPCINLGNRQQGRILTKNIISCDFQKNKIIKNINFAFSESFRKKIKNNPKNQVNMSKIVKKIGKLIERQYIPKTFFDLE